MGSKNISYHPPEEIWLTSRASHLGCWYRSRRPKYTKMNARRTIGGSHSTTTEKAHGSGTCHNTKSIAPKLVKQERNQQEHRKSTHQNSETDSDKVLKGWPPVHKRTKLCPIIHFSVHYGHSHSR